MKFSHFILRKIIKFVATRYQILRLKCTQFNFDLSSAPDPARELTALLRPLAGFKGSTSKGVKGKEWEMGGEGGSGTGRKRKGRGGNRGEEREEKRGKGWGREGEGEKKGKGWEGKGSGRRRGEGTEGKVHTPMFEKLKNTLIRCRRARCSKATLLNLILPTTIRANEKPVASLRLHKC